MKMVKSACHEARACRLCTLLALSALATASLLSVNVGIAAGMHTGGGQQGGDQVRDQIQLQDGSCCTTPSLVDLLSGDEDQVRQQLRDGSCGDGCDGEPDQDRDRVGQP
ncbi:MAG: hypothetical protein KDJ27_11990 [Gammaproteobacteria bacterium]|nr:hypothetical protein [Gammaproteobacteria bacterium]